MTGGNGKVSRHRTASNQRVLQNPQANFIVSGNEGPSKIIGSHSSPHLSPSRQKRRDTRLQRDWFKRTKLQKEKDQRAKAKERDKGRRNSDQRRVGAQPEQLAVPTLEAARALQGNGAASPGWLASLGNASAYNLLRKSDLHSEDSRKKAPSNPSLSPGKPIKEPPPHRIPGYPSGEQSKGYRNMFQDFSPFAFDPASLTQVFFTRRPPQKITPPRRPNFQPADPTPDPQKLKDWLRDHGLPNNDREKNKVPPSERMVATPPITPELINPNLYYARSYQSLHKLSGAAPQPVPSRESIKWNIATGVFAVVAVGTSPVWLPAAASIATIALPTAPFWAPKLAEAFGK